MAGVLKKIIQLKTGFVIRGVRAGGQSVVGIDSGKTDLGLKAGQRINFFPHIDVISHPIGLAACASRRRSACR